MRKNKPILVTGTHRSGTTWVGRVLEKARDAPYVHEPFSPEIEENHCPFEQSFEYVHEGSPKNKQAVLKKYLRRFYSFSISLFFQELFKIRSFADFHWWARKHKKILLGEDHPILKDPIALLSAPWIYKNLNADVVVLIRHPAAFIASMKRKGWTFPAHRFLEQPGLIEKYLEPYRKEIKLSSTERGDLVAEGILAWKMFTSIIHSYQKEYGNRWFFIKHEDLSLDPKKEFSKMFQFLGLEETEHSREFIQKSSQAQSNSDLERNSRENISSWKKDLSVEEIAQIKEGTRPVWELFYTEADW